MSALARSNRSSSSARFDSGDSSPDSAARASDEFDRAPAPASFAGPFIFPPPSVQSLQFSGPFEVRVDHILVGLILGGAVPAGSIRATLAGGAGAGRTECG